MYRGAAVPVQLVPDSLLKVPEVVRVACELVSSGPASNRPREKFECSVISCQLSVKPGGFAEN